MAENSAIEWCDSTFNPWEGCQKVGPGCDHCYAETRNARFGGGVAVNWGPGAPRRLTSFGNWRKPLQWQAGATAFQAAHGRRQRVFCASLADVFDSAVPAGWRSNLLRLIIDTPALDWLLLTKRVGNVKPMLAEVANDLQLLCSDSWTGELPRNVWLGATVCNQVEADRDIPKLLATPATVRFLSVEPMLGAINLRCIDVDGDHEIHPLTGTTECVDGEGEPAPNLPAIDWVICGGESGPKARPMHPDWARGLRDQCAAAGVPFLFKQWGEFMPPESNQAKYPGKDWRDVVDATGSTRPVHFVGDSVLESSRQVVRVGKKAAGRLLDGKQHDGFPKAGRS